MALTPLLFALNTGATFAAQLSVDLIPGGSIENTLTTSGSFNIDILLNDVTDFAGFEFDLGFDNTLLAATSITSGDIFGLDTLLIDDTISFNNISFAETTFASGFNINTPAVIATISFNAIAPGMSSLNLANIILSDSGGIAISPVNLASGDVTVVPVPTAFWLFFTGIAGLFRIAKR